MVIGLLVDGVGSLFVDLLIQDEEAKRAAKAAVKTTAAGISTATGDVGSAIASGAGAVAELAKTAIKDEGGVAAIDTFVTVVGAFGNGVDAGREVARNAATNATSTATTVGESAKDAASSVATGAVEGTAEDTAKGVTANAAQDAATNATKETAKSALTDAAKDATEEAAKTASTKAALEGGLKYSGLTVAGMGVGAAVGHAIDNEHGAMLGLRFGGGLATGDMFTPRTLDLSAGRVLAQVGLRGGGGVAAGGIAMAAKGGDAKQQRATFEQWASLGQTAGGGLAKAGEYVLGDSTAVVKANDGAAEEAAKPDAKPEAAAEPKAAQANEAKSTANQAADTGEAKTEAPTPEPKPGEDKVPEADLLDRFKAMGKKLDAMGLRDLGRATAGATWILMSDEGARGRVGDAHANQGRMTISALALAWDATAGEAAPKAIAQDVIDMAKDTAKVAVDASDGARAAQQELKNDRAGARASDQDRVYERALRRRAARLG
jgi:hypothetical protein